MSNLSFMEKCIGMYNQYEQYEIKRPHLVLWCAIRWGCVYELCSKKSKWDFYSRHHNVYSLNSMETLFIESFEKSEFLKLIFPYMLIKKEWTISNNNLLEIYIKNNEDVSNLFESNFLKNLITTSDYENIILPNCSEKILRDLKEIFSEDNKSLLIGIEGTPQGNKTSFHSRPLLTAIYNLLNDKEEARKKHTVKSTE